MKNIKGILLDLDNTLYSYEPLHELSLKTTLEYISNVAKKDYKTVKETFICAREYVNNSLKDTASCHNRILYFQKTCELLNINPIEHVLLAYDIYWETTLNNLVCDNETKTFLDFIKNYKIVMVTDLTAHIQFRKMQKIELGKYIDFVVTSEEVGIEKPSPKIFERALLKLQTQKDEVIMIGDNLKKDCIGAKDFGIKSFWLNRGEKIQDLPENIIEVNSLAQIVEYLQ